MSKKYLYYFSEGNDAFGGDKVTMKNTLGGKGAGLAEMTAAGMPVPQGFTITTDACTQYYADGRQINDDITADIFEHLKGLEEITGKKFGDNTNPLLVSVRSGARQSMPGMMDTILTGTILRGKTVIGAGCVIGPNSLIEDSTVDEGTTVNASQVYGSHLGPHNNIGPFTHVRVNTVTDYGVHLGAYVETKNSNFARGNTVSHLTYIGDSDVGKYCNFGCGTVTCNYDGKDKFRTTIGDYCFIGCNTNLVAPVKVGDGAYTAAGSTITKDVPAQALGIARDRQTNLEGWAAPKMEAYIAKKKKLEDEQGK